MRADNCLRKSAYCGPIHPVADAACVGERTDEESVRYEPHQACFMALANLSGGRVFSTSSLVSQARRA